MPPAGRDSGEIGRYQRGCDAVFVLVADQVIRVIQLERQTEDGGHGCQRDIALVPVQTNADGLFAVPRTFADRAVVDQRGGIGTRLR